ncbi:hypothetical protein KR093_009940 [Drosophila rubida]|uniref:Uncharacterized protein n=1 Tax=Drosophila rubida TaxID=30044 RepID=A0AAD4PSN9_9MUSC|nr:hypothetical protein KR093_009940 [Drosophila rubida]
MLKHASNASNATATSASTTTLAATTATPAATVNGQLLRSATSNGSVSVNVNVNNNCNSNASSNCNSSSSNTPSTTATATATASAAGGGSGSGGTANSSSSPAGVATAVAATTAGVAASPTPAAVASTARNIHLRPPQPLNISALNASTCSSSNGGVARAMTNLLNIATMPTLMPPMKPLTPLTPNGNSNINISMNNNNSLHHHTYTNQHMLASSSSSNQLQQQQLQAAGQQQQLLSNHNNHSMLSNNNNNNNNILHNYSHCNNNNNNTLNNTINNHLGSTLRPSKHGPGPREVLTSLGLLCLVSLLLALLSLIFLLKISPNSREEALSRINNSNNEDFIIVYDVTLALCALSLSLNLCCLLVCAIQFLFAVKLLRSPMFDGRDNKYLEKSSASRTCAVSGFFISIPVFLTGIILYTFNHFHSTPAIITSVLIGVGIVFCGGAMVHNVFVWQKEKTISYRSPAALTLPQLLPAQFCHQQTAPAPAPAPATTTHPSAQVLHHSLLHHPTSVTPVSPNHSHGSFNPLLCAAGTIPATAPPFLVRPATATPPTPKPINIGVGIVTAATANGSCLLGRELSGSVSPGIPPTLDMSNITNISLHELSTLV